MPISRRPPVHSAPSVGPQLEGDLLGRLVQVQERLVLVMVLSASGLSAHWIGGRGSRSPPSPGDRSSAITAPGDAGRRPELLPEVGDRWGVAARRSGTGRSSTTGIRSKLYRGTGVGVCHSRPSESHGLAGAFGVDEDRPDEVDDEDQERGSEEEGADRRDVVQRLQVLGVLEDPPRLAEQADEEEREEGEVEEDEQRPEVPLARASCSASCPVIFGSQ